MTLTESMLFADLNLKVSAPTAIAVFVPSVMLEKALLNPEVTEIVAILPFNEIEVDMSPVKLSLSTLSAT